MSLRCPRCLSPLPGLGTYCHECHEYVADMTSRRGEVSATTIPDTRSEDERKRDARPAIEALGWFVVDTEQGWRPFTCPECKHPIPGGTRVRKGFPDWLVMGHGLVVFMEWKSAKGRQTSEQKRFQDMSRVAGVPYRVVRTTQEAVEFLAEVRADVLR